jgi:hypothetical protein
VLCDRQRLFAQELSHAAIEPRVSQRMRRVTDHRFEPTQQLVLTLSAGLEQGQTQLDAALDAGVVRGLEVQELDVLVAAPVASVEPVLGLEEQRARDRRPGAGGFQEPHAIRRELE